MDALCPACVLFGDSFVLCDESLEDDIHTVLLWIEFRIVG